MDIIGNFSIKLSSIISRRTHEGEGEGFIGEERVVSDRGRGGR